MDSQKAESKCNKKIKVYLSGYGPFMSITNNPSQLLVEKILSEKDTIEKGLGSGVELAHDEIFQVDVDYVSTNVTKCYDKIEKHISCENKDDIHLIVHFGVNAKSKEINLESKSKNFIHDYCKYSGKISEDGAESIICKLDLDNICSDLTKLGHNAQVSSDAGTYLCNYVYYRSAAYFEKHSNVIPIFIHIPEMHVLSTDECKNCFVDFLSVVKNRYTL